MHIHGTLAADPGNSGHVAHFGVRKVIFIGVGLVHKQGIHAQFLKVDNTVLFLCVEQPIIPKLEIGLEDLHLLECPVLAVTGFYFRYRLCNGRHFRFHGRKLALSG